MIDQIGYISNSSVLLVTEKLCVDVEMIAGSYQWLLKALPIYILLRNQE